MKKRVFIIHGWASYPGDGIFPWLKKELEDRGFEVYAPAMPEPLNPKIGVWVSYLKKQVGVPDENTILFGHSIGAQAILRYLESFGENEKIGGAVFLAGWIHLTNMVTRAAEDLKLANLWVETPINLDTVKSRANKFTAIFSDNDFFVPLSDADVFKEKLGAKIIVESKRGHFSGVDGVKKLPSALDAVLEIAGANK
ncbi:MAG: DUF1749 domain-containing protein [Candidatus Liptonbacteria bacterium]|nr:DUF1749 domain-containing protein [Candidatus Liptonbacteria bacterium]